MKDAEKEKIREKLKFAIEEKKIKASEIAELACTSTQTIGNVKNRPDITVSDTLFVAIKYALLVLLNEGDISEEHIYTEIDNNISKISELLKTLQDKKNENKWILCEDAMPEEKIDYKSGDEKSENVCVTLEFSNSNHGRKVYSSYTINGVWNIEQKFGYAGKVIAWQPLPDVYENSK